MTSVNLFCNSCARRCRKTGRHSAIRSPIISGSSILPIFGFSSRRGIPAEHPPRASLDFHGTEFASHHVHAKTHFSALSCAIRYPKWCSDSLIARRLLAPHRYDFPIIRTPAGRMTPRRVLYQSTIFDNGKRQIPESHESLGDSNVSGISFRGVGAKIPSQMNPLRQSGVGGILLRGNPG